MIFQVYPGTELSLVPIDNLILGTPFTVMGVLKDRI